MAVALQNQDRGYEGFLPPPFGWSFMPSFAAGAGFIGLELLYEAWGTVRSDPPRPPVMCWWFWGDIVIRFH